jgi:GAF domain-containing protein
VKLFFELEPTSMAKGSKSVPRPPAKRKISMTGSRAPRRVGSNKLKGNPRHELIGARRQLAATGEVLQIINASPGNLASVFEAVLERAMRLCEGAFGFLTTYDGDRFKIAAEHGVPPALAAYFETGIEVRPGDGHWRLLAGEDLIHNPDQKNDDAYRAGNPLRRAVVDLGGARSALAVALRKDRMLRGAMTIYRKEVQPFSVSQVALLQHFAAQAVIAVENVRLFEQARSVLRNSHCR